MSGEIQDELVRELKDGRKAIRLLRSYYAAEEARNDCPECGNEGPWEQCEPCSDRIGGVINEQLLFLEENPPATLKDTIHE